MNEKLNRLLLLYSELDYDERKRLREMIEEFERKDFTQRRVANEELKKSLGPTSSGRCQYCGK